MVEDGWIYILQLCKLSKEWFFFSFESQFEKSVRWSWL